MYFTITETSPRQAMQDLEVGCPAAFDWRDYTMARQQATRPIEMQGPKPQGPRVQGSNLGNPRSTFVLLNLLSKTKLDKNCVRARVRVSDMT